MMETFLAIELGKILIEKVRKEMGFSEEDFDCFLEQTEMDNLGFGINGKVK